MPRHADRLLTDRPVVAVAFGIALGWSLIQVAEGVAGLVAGLLYEIDDSGDAPNFFAPYALTKWGGMLTWNVGGRVLSLGPLVAGLLQFTVVLAVALFVYRRSRPVAPQDAGEQP